VALQTRDERRAGASRPGGSFTLRRLAFSRLLLAAVFAAVLISSAVAGALVTLSVRTLPGAALLQLEHSGGASIDISGQPTLSEVATDDAAIRTAIHTAFGTIPVALNRALWSEPLRFPSTGGASAAGAGIEVLGQAAAVDAIAAHARLTAGAWPGAFPARGPIPVAVPAAAAGPLRVSAGQVLTVRNDYTGGPVRLRITGLYVPLQPTSAYWQVSLLGTTGSSLEGTTRTFGPLVTSGQAFQSGRLGVVAASWQAAPTLSHIPYAEYAALAGRISAAETNLAAPSLYTSLTVTSSLPRLLADGGRGLAVSRSLLLISALEMLMLAAASIALAARLVAGQREGETALLSARGMARRQQLSRAAAEAALTVVPAVAGAIAGSLLADLAFPFAKSAQVPLLVLAVAVAITIGATLIMLWPVLGPADPMAAGVRRGRQAALATTAYAGVDIALIAVAALAVWQLRLYTQAPPPGAQAGPASYSVLVVAPALALAGAALVPLRALPLLAGALDRLSARTRRLGTALASWQLSRRPIRQTGPALLVILAVAIGTLALAEHLSWHQSAVDQANFTVGAAERVDLAVPLALGSEAAITSARGEGAAMPVAVQSQTGGAVVLAVGRQAAAVVRLRQDLAAEPAARLWHSIVPPGPPPGLALPGRPARLEISARLDGAAARVIGPMPVTLLIQDADGIVYSVPAGDLAPGQDRLVAVLSPARRAGYPLRLLGASMAYPVPRAKVPGRLTVTVTGLAVSAAASGAFPPSFATGAGLRQWRPAVAVPPADTGAGSKLSPPAVQSTAPLPGSAGVTLTPGHGGLVTSQYGVLGIPAQLTLTAPITTEAIPGIATRAYLSGSQLHLGSVVHIAAGNETSLPVRIVAAVTAFPTAGGSGQGGLIVDQAAFQDQLAAQWAGPVPVTQWWLQRAGSRVRLPAGAVAVTAAGTTAALMGQPLSRVQQPALLAVALAAALLAALGFSVSVAASMQERRSQNALLAALGVSRWERTRQLCLEQLLLSAPAAGAGLVLGAALSWLLVPDVTRTGLGLPPFPPVQVHIPFLVSAGLAVAVTAIPVLAAAATVAYQPDPAAQLRTAETL
jgi:hypothetical protein